jgi:hypothetical protein
MTGPGREHQIVVRNFKRTRDDSAIRQSDVVHVTQQNLDGVTPQDPANRRRDLCRRKASCRDLVQQGLEGVMVFTVDDGDGDGLPRQLAHDLQPAESGADDDNAWPCVGLHSAVQA